MSRAFFGKPEFRLLFGYPSVTLFGPDGPAATASIAVPDPRAALAGLGAEVTAARGRLTAVLPEAEVWRGLLELPARAPLARWRAARAAAACRLCARPEAIALMIGPRDSAGRTPVAAVRREVLAEARGFLARAGLRPAAITGAGVFPGFAAPPRLWTPAWRAVAALRWLVPAAALGGGAALALGLALRPGAEPDLAAALPPPASLQAAVAPAVDAAAVSVRELRPAARPKGFAPPAAARAAPTVRTALPAPATAPLPGPAPVVTMASRNVAFLPALPRPQAMPALRLAELTTARVRLSDLAPAAPFRRPEPPAPAEAAAPAASAATFPAVPAPMHRPRAAAASSAPAPAPAASPVASPAATPEPQAAAAPELGQRPRPRPAAAVATAALATAPVAPAPAVLVASLAPAPDVAALVATAIAAAPEPNVPAPVARPARAAPAPEKAPAKPAVQRQAAPQPVRVQAAPAAKPVVQRQAAPQPVRVQPAPVQPPAKVVRLQPAKPAVKPQAAPQPVRVQAAPAAKPVKQRKTATAKPARSGIVLVGIFGASDDRHALVQLPNGKVTQVRAGDRVQGVQVAAIGSDGVRLRGNGQDALLRMPD